MKPTNLLFILSDEHRRDVSGCYGHPLVQTPHIDSLAERGTRFTNAYTNSPICVPARASLATGRNVHQIGHWDNAFPYHGNVLSWGHRLKAQGYQVDSIGKLHFRSINDDNGFSREIDPLHVAEGLGELISCIRDILPFRKGRGGILRAGPGDSAYLRYDASNTDQACRWLDEHANDEKPWVLFLSFVCPHPPFIAPEAFYNLYPLAQVPLPAQWQQEDWPDHGALNYFREYFGWTEPFDEVTIRRATATYYGICTYLDHNIGRVLRTIEENNLSDKTRIIYTSDHGAMLGARGLFGKFTMYDDAAAIPFIMAGPDVPKAKVVKTPISLVDCFPTVLDAVGASPGPEAGDMPGQSLLPIAHEPDRKRTIFSEYHAAGSLHAIYMLTNGKYKYIHYLNDASQFFDLETDPEELNDFSDSPGHQILIQAFKNQLYTILDPAATDALAKADQKAKVEDFGGEEAVIKRGLSNSPVPGEKPVFRYLTDG